MSEQRPKPGPYRRGNTNHIEGHAQKVERAIAEHARSGPPQQTTRKDFRSRFGPYADL